MRIAILQFSPELGQLSANISRADALLSEAKPSDLDLLVLPELAFTGYNFPSLTAITPHLEPTASGPTAAWACSTARRLNCIVSVGYPEKAVTPTPTSTTTDGPPPPTKNYNSTLTVSPSGDLLAHYRKTHLYYTDEPWASESPDGWLVTPLPLLPPTTTSPPPPSSHPPSATATNTNTPSLLLLLPTAFGICMDLNPHRFLAPWDKYEFATHAAQAGAGLLLLSMAWLTTLGEEELCGEEVKAEPDWGTVGYWVGRVEPLVNRRGNEGEDGDERRGGEDGEKVVVFANRSGVEEGNARYAGSSCVIGVGGEGNAGGRVRVWGVMGRGVEGLLVVDTVEEEGWRW